MKENKSLDEVLIKKIKTDVRLARSARHVPAKVNPIYLYASANTKRAIANKHG